MAHATIAELRRVLDKVPDTAPNNLLLQELLDAATDAIDMELGYSFDGYATPATTRVVYGHGTSELYLPAHEPGSVTVVTVAPGAVAITGYDESTDGSVLYRDVYPERYSVWGRGQYTVTAKWGYGPVPDAIMQVCRELAVNMWREKDKGMFSDVIGVEGSGSVAVGYQKAFTNRQQRILDNYKRTRRRTSGTIQPIARITYDTGTITN